MCAGNIGLAIDVKTLADAAELLRRRLDIRIRIVGSGPREAELRGLIAEKKLDNVEVLEPVSANEVTRLHAESVATLVPLVKTGLTEGTRPRRIIDALAHARPVIFAGSGEMADILNRAGAGIVVPPGSAAELARAVEFLADNPDKAALMGALGRKFVETHLTWSHIVEDFLTHIGISV